MDAELDAPPEVWAEINASIDAYVEEWGRKLREAITSPEHQKFEADWDPEKHPRVPAGSGDESGEFTHAGGGEGSAADTKLALDRVSSLKGLLPEGRNDAAMRTPAFTYRSYQAKLDSIAHELKGDPARAAQWNRMVERYGERNVALAIVDSRLHISASNYERQLKDALASKHDLERFEQPPLMNAPMNDTARLAFAIDKKLTPEEFVQFSLAAQIYSESGYRAVNAPLRIAAVSNETPMIDAATATVRENFDKLLSKAPDIKGEDTIYRAVRLPRMSGYAEKLLNTKGEYTEAGFISASSSRSFCEGWLKTKIVDDDGDPGKSYFLLEWKNAGGAKNVTPFLAARNMEGEINYRPGARVKILDHELLSGKYNFRGTSRVYRVRLEVTP